MTEFTGGPPGRSTVVAPTVLAFVGGLLAAVAVLALVQQFGIAIVGLPVLVGLAVAVGLLGSVAVHLLSRRGR